MPGVCAVILLWFIPNAFITLFLATANSCFIAQNHTHTLKQARWCRTVERYWIWVTGKWRIMSLDVCRGCKCADVYWHDPQLCTLWCNTSMLCFTLVVLPQSVAKRRLFKTRLRLPAVYPSSVSLSLLYTSILLPQINKDGSALCYNITFYDIAPYSSYFFSLRRRAC